MKASKYEWVLGDTLWTSNRKSTFEKYSYYSILLNATHFLQKIYVQKLECCFQSVKI